jgi:hypothetical protein
LKEGHVLVGDQVVQAQQNPHYSGVFRLVLFARGTATNLPSNTELKDKLNHVLMTKADKMEAESTERVRQFMEQEHARLKAWKQRSLEEKQAILHVASMVTHDKIPFDLEGKTIVDTKKSKHVTIQLPEPRVKASPPTEKKRSVRMQEAIQTPVKLETTPPLNRALGEEDVFLLDEETGDTLSTSVPTTLHRWNPEEEEEQEEDNMDRMVATSLPITIQLRARPIMQSDDEDEFVAPHELAARTFVGEVELLFGRL